MGQWFTGLIKLTLGDFATTNNLRTILFNRNIFVSKKILKGKPERKKLKAKGKFPRTFPKLRNQPKQRNFDLWKVCNSKLEWKEWLPFPGLQEPSKV